MADFSPLRAIKDGANAFIKENVPSNMRLYASTMMGDRTPVDESYFPETDLAAMRTAATAGIARKKAEIEDARSVQNTYARWPKDEWHTLEVKNGGLVGTKTMGQQAEIEDKKLKKLLASPDTVTYDDWPDFDETAGWAETTKRSLRDPGYRAATSLGEAVLRKNATGEDIISDSYDWNAKQMLGKKFPTPLGIAELVARNLTQPIHLGNIIGNLMAPSVNNRRKVRINLGRLPGSEQQTPIPTGLSPGYEFLRR